LTWRPSAKGHLAALKVVSGLDGDHTRRNHRGG